MRYRAVAGHVRHMGGWRRALPDHRDMIYKLGDGEAPPPAIDLRPQCAPVKDQGSRGACTAFAGTSHMEFLAKRAGRSESSLAPLYLYYRTRVDLEGVAPTEDSGAMIRDMITATRRFGVCREELWPYSRGIYDQPTLDADADAIARHTLLYFRLPNLDTIRRCLWQGFPFVGGFVVPESLDSEWSSQTGVVAYPEPGDRIIGGHAVLFCGYDDAKQMLLFQNSWGWQFGESGFGWLPYRFVTDLLADDFWTIRSESLP